MYADGERIRADTELIHQLSVWFLNHKEALTAQESKRRREFLKPFPFEDLPKPDEGFINDVVVELVWCLWPALRPMNLSSG